MVDSEWELEEASSEGGEGGCGGVPGSAAAGTAVSCCLGMGLIVLGGCPWWGSLHFSVRIKVGEFGEFHVLNRRGGPIGWV